MALRVPRDSQPNVFAIEAITPKERRREKRLVHLPIAYERLSDQSFSVSPRKRGELLSLLDFVVLRFRERPEGALFSAAPAALIYICSLFGPKGPHNISTCRFDTHQLRAPHRAQKHSPGTTTLEPAKDGSERPTAPPVSALARAPPLLASKTRTRSGERITRRSGPAP